jgi:hypothetical protein
MVEHVICELAIVFGNYRLSLTLLAVAEFGRIGRLATLWIHQTLPSTSPGDEAATPGEVNGSGCGLGCRNLPGERLRE